MADMSPHVSAVFKELFDELKSAKQQQWTITNYGALILAAIYTVRHQLPAEVTHLQSKLKFLAILAIATAVLGSGLLLRIQSHMARTRLRLDEVHKAYFTPDELRNVGFTDKDINKLQDYRCCRKLAHWWRGWEFSVPLMAVLVVGAVLVWFAL
jgi:uncharacterized integral membrane protein